MKSISKNSKITFVELNPTQFGILNGDTGYNIYAPFKFSPRSIPALHGVALAGDYKDVQSISRVYHGINEKWHTGGAK